MIVLDIMVTNWKCGTKKLVCFYAFKRNPFTNRYVFQIFDTLPSVRVETKTNTHSQHIQCIGPIDFLSRLRTYFSIFLQFTGRTLHPRHNSIDGRILSNQAVWSHTYHSWGHGESRSLFSWVIVLLVHLSVHLPDCILSNESFKGICSFKSNTFYL